MTGNTPSTLVRSILNAAIPHREAAVVAAARRLAFEIRQDGAPLRGSLQALEDAVAGLAEVEEAMSREAERDRAAP